MGEILKVFCKGVTGSKEWLIIGWRLCQRRGIGCCREVSHEPQVVGVVGMGR